jgi:hypothetical protein
MAGALEGPQSRAKKRPLLAGGVLVHQPHGIADADQPAGQHAGHHSQAAGSPLARLALIFLETGASRTRLDDFHAGALADPDARAAGQRIDGQTGDDELLAPLALVPRCPRRRAEPLPRQRLQRFRREDYFRCRSRPPPLASPSIPCPSTNCACCRGMRM